MEDDSQFNITPLCPVNDNCVAALPEHIELVLVSVPPKEVGATSILKLMGEPTQP